MANEKKPDRRTLYTRKAIQDAFLRVKRTKEYNTITVTDICREAEISRGTFYAHFRNITEVLDAVLDDALSGMDYLREYLSAPQPEAKCAHPFCRFVRENTELRCILFDDALGHIVVNKLAAIYKDAYMREIWNKGAGLTDQEAEALFYFQINGCFDRTSEQTMAGYFAKKPLQNLQAVCTSLGASIEPSNADLCAVLPFLPQYPVTWKLWLAEEEDEIDGSGRLFLNSSADHYLSVEDAVTVGTLVLDRLQRQYEAMFPG